MLWFIYLKIWEYLSELKSWAYQFSSTEHVQEMMSCTIHVLNNFPFTLNQVMKESQHSLMTCWLTWPASCRATPPSGPMEWASCPVACWETRALAGWRTARWWRNVLITLWTAATLNWAPPTTSTGVLHSQPTPTHSDPVNHFLTTRITSCSACICVMTKDVLIFVLRLKRKRTNQHPSQVT